MNSFYVKGVSKHGYGKGVVHIVETQNGWNQRVVEGETIFKDCLNFDYVSKESEEQLRSWLKYDMKKMHVLQDWVKSLDEEAVSPDDLLV